MPIKKKAVANKAIPEKNTIAKCGFYRLQKRLREAGWYVEWTYALQGGHAWEDMPMRHQEGPHKGLDIDMTKCLISFTGDPFDRLEYPDDMSDEEHEEWHEKIDGRLSEGDMDGVAELTGHDWVNRLQDASPESWGGNEFMFNGCDEGLANLIEILPLIEECGCSYKNYNPASGDIDIRWD